MNDEVIKPASTEWASPIAIASKKDGSLGFLVHYRRVNAITVRDSYELPKLNEFINLLGDARNFSTLDANSGFWRIEIDENDSEKTAFTSNHCLYQFV